MKLDEHMVIYNPTIKYMEVMIDVKISIRGHLKYTCEITVSNNVTLPTKLTNVAGLKHSQRLLIIGVIYSSCSLLCGV